MNIASGQERLKVAAPLLQQMSWSLTHVAGAMWSPDMIDVHLWALIERVNGAPERLVALQEAAAVEGARLVLAQLKAYCPDVSTQAVATSVPKYRQLPDFFEEV